MPPPPLFPVVGVAVPPSVGDGEPVGVLVSVGVPLGDAVAFCGCTKIWISVPLGSTWPEAGFWL